MRFAYLLNSSCSEGVLPGLGDMAGAGDCGLNSSSIECGLPGSAAGDGAATGFSAGGDGRSMMVLSAPGMTFQASTVAAGLEPSTLWPAR